MSDTIIKVDHVGKVFESKDGQVDALKDINLEISKGDIFGIIGMSGAGKSTLVRCLNFLEKPTTGKVYVDGKDLSTLKGRKLRGQRTQISMIFQHFNLLMQRNVLDNVCFPMEILGVPRAEAREKARRLLEEVDLADKENAYPAQLSGGQKQRVAIARALANDPKILLCDEATSALDPTTTKSILALLKQINEKRGITIVIITHAMSVVQEICNRVAIIDSGVVAESGLVTEVFTRPQTAAGKKLVFPDKEQVAVKTIAAMEGKRCVRIVFSTNSSYEPVISNMILKFLTPVNILLADTRDIGGTAQGQMILQLPEEEQVAEEMIAYLQERGLEVEELDGYLN